MPKHTVSNASYAQQPQSLQTKNKTLVVGLTGGIGSGKSAASAWFAEQGIDIIDADVIAHGIVAKGSTALHKIQKKFGDWVLHEDGSMNRAAVRTYVFAHPEALIELEAITHPAIRETAKHNWQPAPPLMQYWQRHCSLRRQRQDWPIYANVFWC